MAKQTKAYLAALSNDYSGMVNEAYNAAKQQLQNVRTQNLEGSQRALPSDYASQLDQLFTTFTQQKAQKVDEMSQKVADFKKKGYIYLGIVVALVLIGLFLFSAKNGGFGFVLIIAAVVCNFFFGMFKERGAKELHDEWIGFFRSHAATIGSKETLHSSATGLYAKIDQLYLNSLDDQARGFEMQQRQMQKQMEAQNEMHQQAMAAQQAQTQALQNQLQQINNSLKK